MFHGSITALVTPMAADGQIDFAALEKLLAYQLENGTAAVVVAGTTGEAATLSRPELKQLWSGVVSAVGGQVPVIAGSGTYSTSETIERTRLAAAVGVDAALLVTPYYIKPPQAGLLAHFAAVEEAVDLPLVLYNVPARTAVDLLPETVAQLARRSGIVGIKEAVAGRERIGDLAALGGDGFCVLSGDDATCMEAMLAGASGVISVASNVAPHHMARLCAAVAAGDRSSCEGLDRELRPVYEALMVQTNPIPVKWALHRMGFIGAEMRLPLTPLEPFHHAHVEAALRSAGLLKH